MSQDVALSRKQLVVEVPMVISEITENSIYVGFFGSLDTARMAEITDKVIHYCETVKVENIILDLSNVDGIDSAVSNHLVKLAEVIELIGINPMFCGLKGMVARTMVAAGIQLSRYETERNLKSALDLCYKREGLVLTEIDA